MRLKQPSFDSENAQLFGFRNSRERLYTKNVHDVSFLDVGRRYAIEIAIEKNKGARPPARSRHLNVDQALVLALVDQRALLDPRHHVAELFADLLDRVGGELGAGGLERG